MINSDKRYYLTTVNGETVDVSEEVYREYRRSERHEKYLIERDRKKKVQSLNQMAEDNMFCDCGIADNSSQVEAIVFRSMYAALLNEYLKSFTEEQQRFLNLLYEECLSVTAASFQMGWSRRKGQYWKRKLLLELRECFRCDDITDYPF